MQEPTTLYGLQNLNKKDKCSQMDLVGDAEITLQALTLTMLIGALWPKSKKPRPLLLETGR
jgi:hypothetical protein